MRDFIFIHIPRTGGSAITKALRPYEKSFSFDNHVPANMTMNRVSLPVFFESFTFSIVRNPFDRLVSLYRYIKRDTSHHLHKDIIKYTHFREFILNLPGQQNCLRDTQSSYLLDTHEESLVNYIMRFETIEEDFQTVCRKIDVKVKLGAKPKIPDYKEWYEDDMKVIVERVFEKDFERFDYEF